MTMARYVCIDASAAAEWVLPETNSDRAMALYEDCQRTGTPVVVPPHLPVEITNAIRRRVARGLMTHQRGLETLAQFSDFAVRTMVPDGLYEEALEIAETFHRPTVYDAHYVALAKLLGCELWTADDALLHALGNEAPWVRWIGDYPLP